MMYEETALNVIASPAYTTGNELTVYLKREKYLVANIVILAILIIFLVTFIRENIQFGSIVVVIGIILCLAAIWRNNGTDAHPFLHVDGEGIVIRGKERLLWTEIDNIVYNKEVNNEGPAYLKIYLRDGTENFVEIDTAIDKPIGVIAAAILKYLQPANES